MKVIPIDNSLSIATLTDDPAQGHAFNVSAKPSPTFTAGTVDRTPAQNADAIYGTMASTAFDDFERSLIKSYGLVVPKK